ncbi:MAG: hypothetical protein WCT44_00465 [Candidatus Paceibacterota bacterium]
MKIQLFKKEKHFTKKEFVFNANLYWKIATTLALIIIILSGVFGYRLFKQTNQEGAILNLNESRKTLIIKKDGLEKILNYFSEREKKSNQILNFPAPVVDPSL